MRMNENESEGKSKSKSKVDSQILRDLVEGWRATAQELREQGSTVTAESTRRMARDSAVAGALEKCASELAANIPLRSNYGG